MAATRCTDTQNRTMDDDVDNCKVCRKPCEDGQQCLGCSNKQCKGWFHIKCIGITQEVYNQLCSNKKKKWFCSNCQTNKTSTKNDEKDSLLEDDSGLNFLTPEYISQIKDKNFKIVLKVLSQVMEKLDSTKNEVSDSVLKINGLNEQVQKLIAQNEKLKKDVDFLFDENDDLKRKCYNNQMESNYQAQELKNYSVEISGIPTLNGENLQEIVSSFGDKIGCKVTEEDIDYLYRLPSRNPNRNGVVILKFCRLKKKEEFMMSRKIKTSMYAQELGFSSPHQIYVNHHLTKLNNNLFYQARFLRKRGTIKYAWVKDGKILIRQNENSQAIYVTNENDLLDFHEDKTRATRNADPLTNSHLEKDECNDSASEITESPEGSKA